MYRHLIAAAQRTTVITVATLTTICFVSLDQSVLGQTLPPLPQVTQHLDSLMVANCGLSHSFTILGLYEDSTEHTSPEQDRIYGAYAVANFNDTDSDGTIDKDDNVVGDKTDQDTGRNHEIDLIKLVISFPATYDPTDDLGNEAEAYKMNLSASTGIKFWKDKAKSEACTEFVADEPGETETVWAEVTAKSGQESDMHVKVEHTFIDKTKPMTDPDRVITEFDRIQVTGIWAELNSTRTDHTTVEITAKSGSTVSVGQGGMPPPGTPEEGDIVMIFDDENDDIVNKNGVTVDRSDQALDSAIFRVKSLNGTDVELEKAGSGTPDPLPGWVGPGDRIAIVASSRVDRNELLKNLHDEIIIPGNRRNTPVPAWGVEFEFKATPPGITWKKLADDNKAIFDITRQMRSCHALFFDDSIVTSSIKETQWPTGDEQPNDDKSSTDEDTITPTDPNNRHDYLYSVDAPGIGPGDKTYATGFSFILRGNFREFVRVDFVSQSTANNDAHWGQDQIKGSRCSDKVKWCTAVNVLPDLDRRDSSSTVDIYQWKKRMKFDSDTGLEEGEDDIPQIQTTNIVPPPYTPEYLTKPDNGIYLYLNFRDLEIDKVKTYDLNPTN